MTTDESSQRAEAERAYRQDAAFRKRSVGGDAIAAVNLPLPLTSLLGRALELRKIERLFNKSRLVTITGTGGVGETRIALELGRRLAGHFQDENASPSSHDVLQDLVDVGLDEVFDPSRTNER